MNNLTIILMISCLTVISSAIPVVRVQNGPQSQYVSNVQFKALEEMIGRAKQQGELFIS